MENPDDTHVAVFCAHSCSSGPDFYVSTRDNSRNHGPGGQDSYDDPSEADPCFAKVVAGFEVVDRIAKSEVEPGWYHRMKNYVGVRSMKIVPPSYAATMVESLPRTV